MPVVYDVEVGGIEKLAVGNWPRWARDVKFPFLEAGLVGYLDGSLKAPSDLKEKAEWLQYNSRIIGTLGRIVDDSLAQDLAFDMLAMDAWALLKKRTNHTGVKLNSMRAAITTKFSKSKATSTTLSELHDHLASAFDAGVPTRDECFIILLLNALDGTDYDWLRKDLLTQFSNSKITLSSKDVVDAIIFAGYNHRQEPSKDLANVVEASGSSRTKSRSKVTRSICGKGRQCL